MLTANDVQIRPKTSLLWCCSLRKQTPVPHLHQPVPGTEHDDLVTQEFQELSQYRLFLSIQCGFDLATPALQRHAIASQYFSIWPAYIQRNTENAGTDFLTIKNKLNFRGEKRDIETYFLTRVEVVTLVSRQ